MFTILKTGASWCFLFTYTRRVLH